MKKTFWMLIALFTCLMFACGGPIKGKDDGDADEDTTVPDTPTDETEDPLDDPVDDPGEDPFEDPGLDPDEDPGLDPDEDTVPDTVTDPGDEPELPTGCVMPTIPDDELCIYYCMEEDTTAMMQFYREVDPGVAYSEVTSCMVSPAARDMLCCLPDYDSGAIVKFNIFTIGAGDGWACASWDSSDPWSGVTNGIPVVKNHGTWLTLNDPVQHSSMTTHCFINFTLP